MPTMVELAQNELELVEKNEQIATLAGSLCPWHDSRVGAVDDLRQRLGAER